MGKSCSQHVLFSLGGQYYSLGQSNAHRNESNQLKMWWQFFRVFSDVEIISLLCFLWGKVLNFDFENIKSGNFIVLVLK